MIAARYCAARAQCSKVPRSKSPGLREDDYLRYFLLSRDEVCACVQCDARVLQISRRREPMLMRQPTRAITSVISRFYAR